MSSRGLLGDLGKTLGKPRPVCDQISAGGRACVAGLTRHGKRVPFHSTVGLEAHQGSRARTQGYRSKACGRRHLIGPRAG